MSERKPYIGAVVQYILSEQDCAAINRQRRTASDVNYLPIKLGEPIKTEENFRLYSGNAVQPGQVVAMVIVAVWGPSATSCVNGQVLLDGNDSFWALSRNRGTNHMNWNWIEEQQ